MSKFTIDSLWKPNSKDTTATVAVLQKREIEWSEKRNALLQEHEKLSHGILGLFEIGGTEKVKQSQQRMSDIEVELQICDLKLKALSADIEKATARESDEKLKALSDEVWKPEAKKEFELRDKAFKQLVEVFGTLNEYREIRRKATWRTVIGRADALGLKPVDDFSQLLANKGNQRPHPVNDETLFARLKEVNGFNDHLKELGIEV